MMNPYTIHIFRSRLHDTVAHQVAVHAVSLCIVGEEEFHPSGPEEQCTRHSIASLFRIPFHEHAADGDDESHKTHRESRVVQRGRFERMFHDDHERMSERHQEQDDEDRTDGLSQYKFFISILKSLK